ncbi:MAG: helix-turn-helix domain-containing protein [Candidatus Ornithomonoglobus sp.]
MNFLKQLRLNKNMYQKDVAEFLGVDRTTYVKYENGSSEPDIETIKKLASLFNVSIDYLLTGKEYAINADFYRTLLSDNGINAIRYYLKNYINEPELKKLENDLGLKYDEMKTFLDCGIQYGGRCLNILDKVLIALDLKVYDVFKECYRAEYNSILNESERQLVEAYREHPEMQAAVNKMLDIQPKPTPIQEAVADTIVDQMVHSLKTSKNNVQT